jgi:hypothetical protein
MGAVIMFAVSFIAHRRARRSGRSPWFWVAMVWVFGNGMMFPFVIVGAILDHIRTLTAESESAASPALFSFWFGVAGSLIGTGLAVWGADRPLPEAPITAEIVGDSENPPA